MNDGDSFAAQAFHPSFGNQLSEGKLMLLQWSLRFESPECEVEMPFQDLIVQVQTQEGRACFQHPQYPDWSLFSSDPAILEHRALLQRTPLRSQIHSSAEPRVWRNA